jgi:hypothetical protein
MTERPIMMTAESVRAILAGSKTQTRRIVKPTRTTPRIAPLQMEPWIIDGEWETDDNGLPCWAGFHPDYPGEAKWFTCPYGQPGDRLWVRETWQARSPVGLEWSIYKPIEREGYAPSDWTVRHAATDDNFSAHSGWNPSIHMPRWACRITLELTGVRVERVQDTSEADAKAEGAPRGYYERDTLEGAETVTTTYYAGFRTCWDSINGKKHPWSSNPWVWVLTFTRVSP